MSWGSPAAFFAMGGYAFYVWGSFVATGICLAAELLLLRVRRRQAFAQVRAERVRREAAP